MKRKLLIIAAFGCLTLQAQQPTKPMGTVNTADANVAGGLEVSAQRARLISNASVTAYDHTAQIDLDRGGLVSVCATSAFHLLRSGLNGALLFGLDRGAMEIQTRAVAQDAIITPDLRFTMLTPGVLDLRIRVTRQGDTCVENRGDTSPVLQIKEGFGDGIYHLAPNQHVLFEHGSLHEVVDNERSNCGCPGSTPAMVATTNPNATSVPTAEQAAALHPFPAAQSEDLELIKPTVPLPPVSDVRTMTLSHVTRSTTSAPTPEVVTPAPARQSEPQAATITTTPVSTVPPETPPGAHEIFHKIGHFFRRIFASKS